MNLHNSKDFNILNLALTNTYLMLLDNTRLKIIVILMDKHSLNDLVPHIDWTGTSSLFIPNFLSFLKQRNSLSVTQMFHELLEKCLESEMRDFSKDQINQALDLFQE